MTREEMAEVIREWANRERPGKWIDVSIAIRGPGDVLQAFVLVEPQRHVELTPSEIAQALLSA